jgi:RNA polymerase sigma factor (sigma-70 family)
MHGAERSDRRYPASCNPNRARVPLTVEQQGLATRYLPLARSIAARVACEWTCARDDFEAAACLALVEAAQSYDPTREANFVAYARPRIMGALYDLQREFFISGCRVRRACSQLPEFVRLAPDVEQDRRIVDREPDEPVGTDLERCEQIEASLRRIPRRHASAIRLIYLKGQSLQQTARRLGCSASFMSRLHREAIAMLGDELGQLMFV